HGHGVRGGVGAVTRVQDQGFRMRAAGGHGGCSIPLFKLPPIVPHVPEIAPGECGLLNYFIYWGKQLADGTVRPADGLAISRYRRRPFPATGRPYPGANPS
ncbi:hypothetical protein, partial [Azospirillum sp. B4]|uniref:hypothetical protein n=1 Tax=Azospirillum sp. B4 TaxID=95605 RepID=UPI001B3BFED5